MDTETASYVSLALSSISAIAAAASAIGAFWTIRKSTQNLREERKAADRVRENERLLNHATITLERAYMALMGNKPNLPVPPADRLGWLTASRLIVEYRSTKTRMTDPLILQECESHEDHWRRQFFLKLDGINNAPHGYYTNAPIQKTSAVIIHAFSDWPKGKEDNIPSTPQTSIEELGVNQWWIQLRHYLGLL